MTEQDYRGFRYETEIQISFPLKILNEAIPHNIKREIVWHLTKFSPPSATIF